MRCAGKVVGFLGDGINDAPALRGPTSSVDSAVRRIKGGRIILLEKNLMVLEEGSSGPACSNNMLRGHP